jgi:DNA-binding transcriptional regulator YiaG
MSNIAALLKSEISRLSRREVRKEVLPLRRSAAAHRREIAALKRTIAALDRRAKSLAKVAARPDNKTAASDETQTRFVAKGLVSLRKRLGLSAADLARLLGVSMQSIYNWEHKKATPRREQVAAIAAVRSIGKKEARQRLDASTGRQPRKKTAKTSSAPAQQKKRMRTNSAVKRRRRKAQKS